VSLSPAKEHPEEEGRKESSEELPEVKPTPRQDGIHTIPIFPFQLVAFEAVIRFQVTEDRLDG